MRITHEVVRDIIDHPTSVVPGHLTSRGTETLISVGDADDRIAVVTTRNDDNDLVVVTLLFRVGEPYLRVGAGYVVAGCIEPIVLEQRGGLRPTPAAVVAAMRVMARAGTSPSNVA